MFLKRLKEDKIFCLPASTLFFEKNTPKEIHPGVQMFFLSDVFSSDYLTYFSINPAYFINKPVRNFNW